MAAGDVKAGPRCERRHECENREGRSGVLLFARRARGRVLARCLFGWKRDKLGVFNFRVRMNQDNSNSNGNAIGRYG